MRFGVSSIVTVLKKGELKVSDSGTRGHLMVMSEVDCGSIYVPEEIYNLVNEGQKVILEGIYQSFDGKNYISWKTVRPCKG